MQITEDCINAVFKYWFKCDRGVSFFLYSLDSFITWDVQYYKILKHMNFYKYCITANFQVAAIDRSWCQSLFGFHRMDIPRNIIL